MKRILCALAALLILASCEIIDYYSLPSTVRGNRTTVSGYTRDSSRYGPGGSAFAPQSFDTVVWVSGVCVPGDYDWQKDSAMGVTDARLVLYRDSTLLLSAPIGPEYQLSPYPDAHHLLGGHIYSEYIGAGKTTILRDGKPLFEFAGAEYLKGLVLKDSEVYTLGCNPAESSHSLRRGATSIVRLSGGVIPGGFVENAPALYEDSGHLYFSFIDGHFINLVEDGVIKPLPSPSSLAKVYDCRVFDGEIYLAYIEGRNLYCMNNGIKRHIYSSATWEEDVSLFRFGEDIAVAASNSANGGCSYTGLVNRQQAANMPSQLGKLDKKNLLFYQYDERLIGIYKKPLSIFYTRPVSTTMQGPFYRCSDAFVYTKQCLQVADNHIYAAVSAINKGSQPFVLKDGKVLRNYPFNGYLTGIEVEVLPTNLNNDFRWEEH